MLAAKAGLKIAAEKINFMTNIKVAPETLNSGNLIIEQVNKFNYLLASGWKVII